MPKRIGAGRIGTFDLEYLLDRLLALRLDVVAFVLLSGAAWIVALRMLQRHDLSVTSLRAVGLVSGAMVVCAVLFVEYAGRQEQARLRAMLDGIAPSYAIALEYIGYENLTGRSISPDDPLYQRVVELQKDWLATTGAADDVYTLHRADDGGYFFVVDSETDYDGNGRYDGEREQRTPIGESYEPDPDEAACLQRAFAGECVFDGIPSTDRWGTWVTSFAPIRDRAGNIIAVVGVDYEAHSWLVAILMRRVSTLCLFAMLLSALGVGATLFQMQRDLATQRILARNNAALEAANRDLGVANRLALSATNAKTEFLANMSHELRTPLTAILGFADLLTEEVPAGAAGEHVEIIRSNGRHLLTILSDILDLSKLEAGVAELQLAKCNPEGLAREVIDVLAHQALGKGIDLRLDRATELPAEITTDPVRLRQVLFNVVGNAIKFTEQGSVTIGVAHHANEQTISFLVADTGVGIARANIDRLFIPFSQVDSSMSRREGGSGLGLSISRRLVCMLGGDISVASELGQGSTFRVAIPTGDVVMQAPQPAPALAGKTTANGTRLSGRVLLAEDGPDNQRLIGFLLRKQGLEVDIVANGLLAVEALHPADGRTTPAYDLVLMDMQMPEMDGYEATRTLRRSGFKKPIIAVTAHAMSRDRDRCLAAGCDEFLTKPIERPKMIETVRRMLVEAAAQHAGD